MTECYLSDFVCQHKTKFDVDIFYDPKKSSSGNNIVDQKHFTFEVKAGHVVGMNDIVQGDSDLTFVCKNILVWYSEPIPPVSGVATSGELYLRDVIYHVKWRMEYEKDSLL